MRKFEYTLLLAEDSYNKPKPLKSDNLADAIKEAIKLTNNDPFGFVIHFVDSIETYIYIPAKLR